METQHVMFRSFVQKGDVILRAGGSKWFVFDVPTPSFLLLCPWTRYLPTMVSYQVAMNIPILVPTLESRNKWDTLWNGFMKTRDISSYPVRREVAMGNYWKDYEALYDVYGQLYRPVQWGESRKEAESYEGSYQLEGTNTFVNPCPPQGLFMKHGRGVLRRVTGYIVWAMSTDIWNVTPNWAAGAELIWRPSAWAPALAQDASAEPE